MSTDPREFRDEADFQRAVVRAARTQGARVYHTHDSRKSEPGFPDLVILGRAGVLYRELKMPGGKASPEQVEWLKALQVAGENAAIWRPEHWPNLIMAELRDLGRAYVPLPKAPSQAQLRAHLQKGRSAAEVQDPRDFRAGNGR